MTEAFGVLFKEQSQKLVGMNRADIVCTELGGGKICQILCDYQVTVAVNRRSDNVAVIGIRQIHLVNQMFEIG